jgi:hypothetical protein
LFDFLKNEIIESIRRFVRPNDFDRWDIYILKDDLNTLKVSLTFSKKKNSRKDNIPF